MPPNGQIDPFWNIFRAEGIRDGHSWSEFFFISVLMKYKNGEIFFDISLWRFENCLSIFEKIIENWIFDVSKTIKSYFCGASLFFDDQGLDKNVVET